MKTVGTGNACHLQCIVVQAISMQQWYLLPPCRGFPPYTLAFSRLVDKYLKCPKGEITMDNASEKLMSVIERQTLKPYGWPTGPGTPPTRTS